MLGTRALCSCSMSTCSGKMCNCATLNPEDSHWQPNLGGTYYKKRKYLTTYFALVLKSYKHLYLKHIKKKQACVQQHRLNSGWHELTCVFLWAGASSSILNVRAFRAHVHEDNPLPATLPGQRSGLSRCQPRKACGFRSAPSTLC